MGAEKTKYKESRMRAMAVSVPKMKKVARSEVLFLENLPAVVWRKIKKMPGASCKRVTISMEKTKIPIEVKTLMLLIIARGGLIF